MNNIFFKQLIYTFFFFIPLKAQLDTAFFVVMSCDRIFFTCSNPIKIDKLSVVDPNTSNCCFCHFVKFK